MTIFFLLCPGFCTSIWKSSIATLPCHIFLCKQLWGSDCRCRLWSDNKFWCEIFLEYSFRSLSAFRQQWRVFHCLLQTSPLKTGSQQTQLKWTAESHAAVLYLSGTLVKYMPIWFPLSPRCHDFYKAGWRCDIFPVNSLWCIISKVSSKGRATPL